MRAIEIAVLCVLIAMTYWVVHDQVTARVCVEYFTVGHVPIFHTSSPSVLAFGWGILATWWLGVLLGIPLAIVARAGSRPKRTARSLVPYLAWLLGVMACCALAAGIAGWLLARSGMVSLAGPIAYELPADRHVPFLADLWAHRASYFVGVTGSIVVIAQVWRARSQVASATENPLMHGGR